ncbi:hypothetical protein BC938DRAFT_481712 [Jimgerdemannia flammicorona]|uniref:Pentacotripeptide-repeat region of PRORP domain-containing protein n=1 Tax=Jimgerdemannia flammicorona TaxID=994334 RepID=A0A433QFQ2_9FUNG|nr:hypothetical protein BC938DRAFT_481712 [Jimgerdemannia flammicorona]
MPFRAASAGRNALNKAFPLFCTRYIHRSATTLPSPNVALPFVTCCPPHVRLVNLERCTPTACAATLSMALRRRMLSTAVAERAEAKPLRPQHRESFEKRKVPVSAEMAELWTKLISMRKSLMETTEEDMQYVWKLYCQLYKENRSELQWLRPKNINTLFRLLYMHSVNSLGLVKHLQMQLTSLNLKLSLADYQIIMETSAKVDKPQKARAVLYDMKRDGVVPTVEIYNTLIKIYVECNGTRIEIAENLVDEMQREWGLHPNTQTFMQMLLGYLSPWQTVVDEKRVRHYFAKLMDIEEKSAFQKTIENVTALLNVVVRWRRYETALFMFEAVMERGLKFKLAGWNMALKACAGTGDMEKTEIFLQRMTEDELSPDAETFKALIIGNLTQSRPFSGATNTRESLAPASSLTGLDASIKTFRAMLAAGFEPDTKIYTSFVEAYMRAERTPENIVILDRLYTAMISDLEDPPALGTFERLVEFHIKRGALAEARRVYYDARQRFAIPFDSGMIQQVKRLIMRFAQRRLMLSATALIYDMLYIGSKPNSRVTCSLIEAHAYYKDMEGARQLVEVLREHGIETDNWVYGTMIFHYFKLDDVRSARELYEERMASGASCKPYVLRQWCNMLLNGYLKAGNINAATRFFNQMLERDQVTPDLVTFNTLLNGYLALGMNDEAVRTMGMMEVRGIRPSMYTISILIFAHIGQQDVKGALNVFHAMPHAGKRPPIGALTALILALFRNGDVENAERIWAFLKRKEAVSPNVYQAMMVGYGQAGAYDKVRALYKKMRNGDKFTLEEGLRPMVEQWVAKDENKVV